MVLYFKHNNNIDHSNVGRGMKMISKHSEEEKGNDL